MAGNGKIARLPKNLRDELNRRLENGEQGKNLVIWLNSLPEVQAIVASEFGGQPIRGQNLSEWKKRGYLDWQTRTERLDLVRHLQEDAKEFGTMANLNNMNRAISVILTAELAQIARELTENVPDSKERTQCLSKIVGRFAQLRREESNARRAEIDRERWDEELAQNAANKRTCSALMPLQAFLFQQAYIDMFSRLDGKSLAWAAELADELYPAVTASTTLAGVNPTKSD